MAVVCMEALSMNSMYMTTKTIQSTKVNDNGEDADDEQIPK